MTDEGKNCPSCGAEGKAYKGEHETAVHNHTLNGVRVVDIGWRCWQCGHEWGFAYPQHEEEP